MRRAETVRHALSADALWRQVSGKMSVVVTNSKRVVTTH